MKDTRLDIQLDDKEGKLNWRSVSRQDALEKVGKKYLSQLDKLEDDQEDKILDVLGELRFEQAKIVYHFPTGMPNKEWFKRKEFPDGQHEYNLMVFRSPQILY